MKNSSKHLRLSYNSPVILTFSLICLAALILGIITRDESNKLLFSVYRFSPTDPLGYVRLFTHVFGHTGVEHFMSNIMLILVIGPMLEEKYGSKNIALVIVITALITGLANIIFFPRTMLLGASGVVFAFILMSSFASFKSGTIPLTFILVAAIYIGSQIYQGIFVTDNISNLTHILGGAVGALAGYWMSKNYVKSSSGY